LYNLNYLLLPHTADDVDVLPETSGTNNEVFTDDKNEEAEKPCWGLGCTIS